MNKIGMSVFMFLLCANANAQTANVHTTSQSPVSASVQVGVGQLTSSSKLPVTIQGPHPRTVVSSGAIDQGDVIKAEATQTLKLKFSDGSEIWVAPSTSVTVQAFSATTEKRVALFHLESGSLRAIATKYKTEKPSLVIHTKSATMGVRGTEFFVQVDKNQKTSLYTLDGAVAIAKTQEGLNSDKSSRLVEKGKYSACSPTQALPTASKKYSMKELTTVLQTVSPEIASDVMSKSQERVKAAKAAAASNPKKSNSESGPSRKPKPKTRSAK